MTRLELRSMLRRRLQEVTAAQWTDATLNSLLNLGLQYMQKKVQAVDPEWLVYTDTTPIVANQRDYPKPSGFQFEIAVYVSTNNGTSYSIADFVEYQDLIAGDVEGVQYSYKGRFIALSPTPTANSTAGLKLEWVPTLAMGNDDETPDLQVNLHEGIVYRAEMLALGETAQQAEVAAVELAAVVGDITSYYRRKGTPDHINFKGFIGWDVE